MKHVSTLFDRIRHSDIARRIASGASWSFLGTATAKFLVLVSGIFCARILGQSGYGELGMVRSTISLFVAVGSAGLGLTASKYISEYRAVNNTNKISEIYVLTNGLALVTGVLVSLLVYFASHFLAANILNAPYIENDLKVGSILLFITVLNGAQNGVLSAYEDFKSIAINTFISSFVEAILIVIGAKYWGVTGALLGFGFSYIMLFILNYAVIHRTFTSNNVKLKWRISRDSFTVLYRFSIPALLSSLLVTPAFWIAKAMLANKAGFAEVGLYEVADQWKIIILFFPSAVSQIVLPILSNLKSSDSGLKKYWKVLWINVLLNGGVCLILSLIVIIFNPQLLSLYGSEYTNSLPLIIIVLSTVFTSIAQVVGLAIASMGKMWTGCIFNIIWAFILILFCYIFINMGLGATGIALALLLSYLIHTIIQLIYLKLCSK